MHMLTGLTLVGELLVGLALLDVFLTVLHPQAESPFSSRLHRLIWGGLRLVAQPWREPVRHQVLGLALPLIIVALMLAWLLLLLLGFGLIYTAWLGQPGAFQTADGAAPLDWPDVLYFSGVTLGTIGYGDIQPRHPWLRLAAVVEGLSGIVIAALSVAYLLEVYPILQRKAVLAALLNEATAGRVDGLPLLARYLGRGNFETLAGLLGVVNAELLALAEAHRRLPVLHYSHPPEPERSFLRVLLVVSNLVAALRYGLAGGAGLPWSQDPRVHDLHDTLLYTLHTLGSSVYLPLSPSPDGERDAGEITDDFRRLCERLAALGLPTPGTQPAAAGAATEFERAVAGYRRFAMASDLPLRSYRRNSGYRLSEAIADAPRPDQLVRTLETEDG